MLFFFQRLQQLAPPTVSPLMTLFLTCFPLASRTIFNNIIITLQTSYVSICTLSAFYLTVVNVIMIQAAQDWLLSTSKNTIFLFYVQKQMKLSRREGELLRLPRNNLISLLPRRSRFRPPGLIKTPGSFLRLMPADMAISSAPALTGEKCQVSPRRRDRGVNDILSNYLSPLHRPGIGTWGDHMRQAITWKKILITAEVEHASDCPPTPPQLSHPRPGLYFLKWRRLKHCGIYSVNTLIPWETSWKGYFQARNQS